MNPCMFIFIFRRKRLHQVTQQKQNAKGQQGEEERGKPQMKDKENKKDIDDGGEGSSHTKDCEQECKELNWPSNMYSLA